MLNLKDLIYIKDNVFSDEEYNIIRTEMNNLKPYLKHEYHEGISDFTRIYLDDYFINMREESKILALTSKVLFNQEMFEIADKIPDFGFRTLYLTTKHESQFTCYLKDNSYRWHTDTTWNEPKWNGRTLNWIYYVTDDFDGGELEINLERLETLINTEVPIDSMIVKPKKNRLVIMPAHLSHRVLPLRPRYQIDSNNINFDHCRVTINGHIGFVR